MSRQGQWDNLDSVKKGQCGFSWRTDRGIIVRCIHARHTWGRHEHGLAWVRVGAEENALEGHWV